MKNSESVLCLNDEYDENNPKGKAFEILGIENDPKYRLGVAVLVYINGKETWLTIDWFTITNRD